MTPGGVGYRRSVSQRCATQRVCSAVLLAALCLASFAGCQSLMPQIKAPLDQEGELLVYLQPFPQEAERLRFRIEALSARRNDGIEIPISLKFTDIKGREMTRQRFLGSAQLPPGPYSGLTIKVKEAFVRVEDGEAQLLAPDRAIRTDFPFVITRKKASLLLLAFQSRESLRSGFSFSPAFFIVSPPRPVAGLTGYITNRASNNILIIDKRAGQVAGAIATEGGPAGMALNQRGLKVYVAVPESDTIEVIDVIAGEITDKMRLNIGDRPRELALTPDGRTLLSVNTGSNTLSFIDALSLTEQSRATVGNGPVAILMDPAGRRAYVFNGLSSTISVIDVANRALVTTISTDPGPLRGQFNRAGNTFYVIHEWSPYVAAIDTRNLSVKRTMATMGLISIKVDSNTDLVYLARVRDSTVGVYEPFSFAPVDFIQTGAGVAYMTIDGDTNNLLMVSPDTQKLIITNLISKKILSVIDTGDAPYFVTVMGER